MTVRPNRYQPGRAHVIVYNWDLQPQVSVDLSMAGLGSGQRFEIRDVQEVEVWEDRSITLMLLFDPEHNMEERILKEQFVP